MHSKMRISLNQPACLFSCSTHDIKYILNDATHISEVLYLNGNPSKANFTHYIRYILNDATNITEVLYLYGSPSKPTSWLLSISSF